MNERDNVFLLPRNGGELSPDGAPIVPIHVGNDADVRSIGGPMPLYLFAAHERAIGLAETTVRNRHSILSTLEARSGRPLLELDTYALRVHLGREGIKASSRRTEHAAVTAFYRFALDEGLCDVDPAAKLKRVRVPRGEPRPFTREQIDRMIESGAYRRTRAMIMLGYYQGFRVSQIARVRGEDIDLMTMTIRTVGKGSKEGTLPLHPVIAELALTMPRKGWWFPARGGRTGHVQPGSVSDLIRDAKLRAGITDPTLTAHSLRHSFGTELVEEGVDTRVVQELMMHESLSSTQIYTAVSARLKREGLASLPSRPVPEHSGRREQIAA